MSSMRIKVLAAIIVILLPAALTAFYIGTSIHSPPDLTRVACVGDSITEITTYPNDLQTFIGPDSAVGNFGVSGATMTRFSVKPYLSNDTLQEAKAFQPTTVIIMLGTNDARSDVYPYIGTFVDDYKQLISQFQALDTKPQIFLVIPPPIFSNSLGLSSENFTSGVTPRIEQVAKETGLPLIDAYTPLLDHPEFFADGVHPNGEGAQVIAETIYKQITTP